MHAPQKLPPVGGPRKSDDSRPAVTVTTHDDGSVTIAPTTIAAPDVLDRLPGPLERAAADRLVRDGVLRAAKIGRHWYARRSDILALVDQLSRPRPQAGGDVRVDLAKIAERERAPKRVRG